MRIPPFYSIRLLGLLFGIALSCGGCVVVTRYPYKPLVPEGVSDTGRCAPNYVYRIPLNDGVVLRIGAPQGTYNHLDVAIFVEVSGDNKLQFLDKKIRLVDVESGNATERLVKFFSAKESAVPHPEVEILTARAFDRNSGESTSNPYQATYAAWISFGNDFPKKVTLYLPPIRLNEAVVNIPPITFEMQTEKLLVGILCGL